MRITKQDFDDYWNAKGRYLGLNNPERFRCNLSSKISEFQDTDLLNNYVCQLRSGRETTRKVVLSFYDYLKEMGRKPDASLLDMKFYDHPFERQLEIAKFLHTPKTPKEIQEHFGIDARTRRKDLEELEKGITVLGATIKIKKEKQGKSCYYRTTLHPVFLPLNLTEVYAMTVYLQNVIKDNDPNAQIIQGISERIKAQLSDYAYKRLFPGDDQSMYKNEYMDDEKLATQREGILMYLMKSRQPCRFIWKGNEYKGTVVLDHAARRYRIKTDNGAYLDADFSEVDFVIDSLQYK